MLFFRNLLWYYSVNFVTLVCMSLDGSSEFGVEDVQTFVDSLSKVLLTRLQLGPNLVDGVNKKVAAVRAVWDDPDGDLMQKVPKLKALLDEGVAMFRS